MQILVLLLIKLGLCIVLIHRVSFGQFSIYEDFDPEESLPESDLVILNTVQTLYDSLSPEAAVLLSQLSFLSDSEIKALDQIVSGEGHNLIHNTRLYELENTLWGNASSEALKGAFIQRVNMTDDIQYKWISEINFDRFTLGLVVEKDPGEANILDHHSLFLQKHQGDLDYTIGHYQILAGYGLISWRSIPVKSHFRSTNSAMHRGKGIQPFRSGHESWAYRGLGWEQSIGGSQTSVGLSHRTIDGSMR